MKRKVKHSKTLILIIIIMLCITIPSLKTKAYTETGHDDFLKIETPEYARIIEHYGYGEIYALYDEVKFALFGWKTSYINYNVPITYDGNIIFSRSNKTSSPITISYIIREISVVTTSVKVEGSVSAKITGKMKKVNVDGTLQGEYNNTKETENEYQKEEKTEFKFTLNPNKRIIIITTGKGMLTSGVSKHYLFGFTTKKGIWERIDVETTYFEIREEDC